MNPDLTLSPSVRFKLSAMMFLQFFVWGAWFVTIATYLVQGLSFPGTEAARLQHLPWGAIVAPFVIGMIADRFFAAEKVLGVLHLVGAGLLFWASTVTTPMPSSGCCSLRALLQPDARARERRGVQPDDEPGEAIPGGAALRHDRLDRGRAHRGIARGGADRDSAADRDGGLGAPRLVSFALPHTPPSRSGARSPCATCWGSMPSPS